MKIFILIMALIFSLSSWAHPGVTNDKGCHINSDTGRKHCHKAKEKKSKALKVQKNKKKRKKKKS